VKDGSVHEHFNIGETISKKINDLRARLPSHVPGKLRFSEIKI
jgi:hypothetical protein